MVPIDRNAAARGADHSIWRKQTALCHADGHQARQEQRTAHGERRGTGRCGCAGGDTRTDLRAEKAKIDTDSGGIGERSCGHAGGEAENGGAGAMSVLLVLEERGGKIRRPSWEALAAAHRLAPAQEITAVVIGAETET